MLESTIVTQGGGGGRVKEVFAGIDRTGKKKKKPGNERGKKLFSNYLGALVKEGDGKGMTLRRLGLLSA